MSTTTYTSTNARPCASCGQVVRCLDSCMDRWHPIPVSPGPAVTAIQPVWNRMTPHNGIGMLLEGPQIVRERRSRVPRVPVGGIGMIVVGLALMALGFVMNESVSQLIYNHISR